MAKARETHPDLIMLDLHMPALDGFATVGELRREPGFAPIPMVALTASAMQGDRERALAAGFSGLSHQADPAGRLAQRSGASAQVNR